MKFKVNRNLVCWTDLGVILYIHVSGSEIVGACRLDRINDKEPIDSMLLRDYNDSRQAFRWSNFAQVVYTKGLP